jgi:hypothetical protein
MRNAAMASVSILLVAATAHADVTFRSYPRFALTALEWDYDDDATRIRAGVFADEVRDQVDHGAFALMECYERAGGRPPREPHTIAATLTFSADRRPRVTVQRSDLPAAARTCAVRMLRNVRTSGTVSGTLVVRVELTLDGS